MNAVKSSRWHCRSLAVVTCEILSGQMALPFTYSNLSAPFTGIYTPQTQLLLQVCHFLLDKTEGFFDLHTAFNYMLKCADTRWESSYSKQTRDKVAPWSIFEVRFNHCLLYRRQWFNSELISPWVESLPCYRWWSPRELLLWVNAG